MNYYKDLETEIQGIFNTTDLQVEHNIAYDLIIMSNGFMILGFSLNRDDSIEVTGYKNNFFGTDDIYYLNRVRNALNIIEIWNNKDIQKKVIEVMERCLKSKK